MNISPTPPPKPQRPARTSAVPPPPKPNRSANNTLSVSSIVSERETERETERESIRVCVPHTQRVRTHCGEEEEEEDVCVRGQLAKRTREGEFEKYVFLITSHCVCYYRITATTPSEREISVGKSADVGLKSIPLTDVLVRPLIETDYFGSEKRERAFRFLSVKKSFLVRAKTVALRDEWFAAMDSASREARAAAGLSPLTENRVAPLWALSESSCQICRTNFTFFTRKHHCRNCGRCVCEACSREKVRIPKFDPRTLFKVCSECAARFKERRQYGAPTLADETDDV